MLVCFRSQPSCHTSLKFAGYSNLLNGDILKMSNLKLSQPGVFRDRPPKPTRNPRPPTNLQVEEKEHITSVSSSKIKELNQALKGHAKSYSSELQRDSKSLNHFRGTKVLVKSHYWKPWKSSNSLKRLR